VPGLTIRQYGDPVLKEATREVEQIDAKIAALAESMIDTMYAAPGSGLAANQIGVQKRIFVYDIGDGPSSTPVSSRATASGPTTRGASRSPV
jgi:peptide deformylase